MYYTWSVRTVTVRVPRELAADIETEARDRGVSKSEVIRERLKRAPRQRHRPASLDAIADLIGSVDGLPADLSSRNKEYLRSCGPEMPSLMPALLFRRRVQREDGFVTIYWRNGVVVRKTSPRPLARTAGTVC